MKKMTILFASALMFVACKKQSGPDCTAAINRGMELSKDTMAKMGNDQKTMDKMKELGVQHCKDDKWSDDAIKCMVDAKTMQDAQACYGKLTPDQQQKMNSAAMEMHKSAAVSAAAAPAGSDTGSAAAAKP